MTIEDLADVLERAAATQPFEPDPEVALGRAHRTRRRRRIGGVVAGVAALAVAIGITLAVRPSGDTASIAPTGGTTVLWSRYGVDVTWLPAGIDPHGGQEGIALGPFGNGPADGPGRLQANFWGTGKRWVQIEITRGSDGPNVADAIPEKGATTTATTVRGHTARLIDTPAQPGLSHSLTLAWDDRPGVEIRIHVSPPGTTLADARRIADDLVVHASGGPVPRYTPPVAQQVADAALDAFSEAGPESNDPAVTALQARIQQLVRGQVGTVLTGAAGPPKVSGTTAVVVLHQHIGKQYPHLVLTEHLVSIGGKWQLTHASVCASLAALGGTCPKG